MPRYGIVRSALAWDVANLGAAATRLAGFPYIRVRYEDLVGDPRGEVSRIVRELDLGTADLSDLKHRSVDLGTAHTVAGNPIRFREGPLELRADEEWRSKMPRPAQSVVTGLTLPLLRRYGYAARPGGADVSAATPVDPPPDGGS